MKRITLLTVTIVVAITLISCKGKTNKTTLQNPQSETDGTSTSLSQSQETPLHELAAKHGFKIGTVINPYNLNKKSYTDMVKADFNSLTAGNEFKAYSLLNQGASQASENGMPAMNYTMADNIAKFAQENGIGVRGHVLVWDAYMPSWFFREGYTNDGAFVSSDNMKKRLQYYIEEVVAHFETNFPGVVYCWDVVNEAVADGKNEAAAGDERMIRTKRGGTSNLFYDVIGPDYVELSFKYAREAVNKTNPAIKLFYNDYNTFYSPKKEAIGKLLQSINKNEKLCDGLGMQGYVGGYGQQNGCMNPNDIQLFGNAIKFYSDMGLEVQVTELALRNYEVEKAAEHENFYADFFQMLVDANKNKQALTCVAIWGICDNPNMPKNDYSYKMNGPYCGLFNLDCTRKPEYFRVAKVLE